MYVLYKSLHHSLVSTHTVFLDHRCLQFLQKAVEVDGGDSKDDDDDMLAINVAEMEKTVAQNWGFLYNKAIFSIIGGTFALLVPTLASGVAYHVVTFMMAFAAYFNVFGLFFAESGFKIPSLVVGILYGALAYRMWQMPFETLSALTYLVSATCIVEGAYEGAVAIKNRSDLPLWGWRLFSGLTGVACGAYAVTQMPIASLVVPGIALGVNLISSGITGVIVALQGRDLANDKLG